MTNLSEETGHIDFCIWIIFFLLDLLLELLLRFFFTFAKSKFKEVLGSSLFSCLFFKDILEQVLVPLDKPL